MTDTNDAGPDASAGDRDARVIAEFRANHGAVGGALQNRPVLLLHHRGARSGGAYVTPLVYLPEAGDHFIFASAGGHPRHPGWYHNVLAHPRTEVEIGTRRFAVEVREVTGLERDRLYAIQATQMPVFEDYARRTAGVRTIPVLHLRTD